MRGEGRLAPVVRVDGQLMILDPAVEPEGPLPIVEWLSRFVASEVDMAVCHDRLAQEPIDRPEDGADAARRHLVIDLEPAPEHVR